MNIWRALWECGLNDSHVLRGSWKVTPPAVVYFCYFCVREKVCWRDLEAGTARGRSDVSVLNDEGALGLRLENAPRSHPCGGELERSQQSLQAPAPVILPSIAWATSLQPASRVLSMQPGVVEMNAWNGTCWQHHLQRLVIQVESIALQRMVVWARPPHRAHGRWPIHRGRSSPGGVGDTLTPCWPLLVASGADSGDHSRKHWALPAQARL